MYLVFVGAWLFLLFFFFFLKGSCFSCFFVGTVILQVNFLGGPLILCTWDRPPVLNAKPLLL